MDCVYSLDRNWRITYLNERAKQHLGRNENLVGAHILDLFTAGEASAFAEAYRRVMNGGRAESFEACVEPSGDWYEVHVTPTEDGLTVFYRDVTDRKRTQQALHARNVRAQSILDSVPQLIWTAAPDGRLDYISEQWQALSDDGLASSPNDWLKIVHPDDAERAARQWMHSVHTGEPYEIEFRFRSRPGEYLWILVRARPVRDDSGRIIRWYGTCTDINQRVLTQVALQASEAINRSIINATPDCISMLDLDGNVLFINEAGLRALKISSPDTILNKPWGESFAASVRGAAMHAIASAREGRIGHFTALARQPSGRDKWWDAVVAPVLDGAGKPNKMVVISRDITHQKTAEERVRWSANHDSLTRLPNRAFFQQKLDQKLKSAGCTSDAFGLLLLDLDDFKRVNDTLGHDAGDALLCCFAEQLQAAARTDDFVARLGGDEFAVILNGVSNAAEVETAVQAILKRLHEPCVYRDNVLDCQASIGASLFPHQGSTRAELLKAADIALYVAKSSSRGGWRLFESSMRAEMQQRVSMLSVTRDALNDNRIEPFYQPKVDLVSGELAGFEALLRWRHPGQGLQLPHTIAAAFQDLELAAKISDRMIDRVTRDIRRWREEGLEVGHVAINAAAAEFRRGNFAERLLERLHDANIPAPMIQLEVTESVFLGRGAEHVERALKTLSRAGVQIGLDDFGSGYASLSHLKQFHVDVLKIDRSFISGLGEESENAAIVRAVINLGKSLGIRSVAEGVETASQAAYLAAQSCDFGQGFLYGRAIAASDIPALIQGWTGKTFPA